MNIFACSAKKLLTQICTIVYNNPCREIYVLGSSSGLGHRPLTAGTGVRLPYRVPKKLPIRELFSYAVNSGDERCDWKEDCLLYSEYKKIQPGFGCTFLCERFSLALSPRLRPFFRAG